MLSFGTDGVRAVANTELTPEFALSLGRAAARTLGGRRMVVGVDGRRSGPMLAAALAAGAAAEGIDVEIIGLVPTPVVAHESARRELIGAMVSASHNPFADNGIKFFAPGGRKLTDADQEAIEARLRHLVEGSEPAGGPGAPAGADIGFVQTLPSVAVDGYAESVCEAIEGRRLDGLEVVLDCAHGAGSEVGPRILRALGASVHVIHGQPNGVNINAGAGSTDPAGLQKMVVERGADLGLALDGDADRLLAIAGDGTIVDGDEVMGILAIDRKARGALPHDTVVVTVMTNLGFRLGMADAGITVVDTAVGDRYVLEGLEATGAVLGGEQSGHVIQTDLSTTGDGILTAVTLLDVVKRSGRTLAELAASTMTKLPQVLVNVRLDHLDPTIIERLADDIAAAESRLGTRGRVLVRASGTEPKIRVMVEAETDAQAAAEADQLAEAVRTLAGS